MTTSPPPDSPRGARWGSPSIQQLILSSLLLPMLLLAALSGVLLLGVQSNFRNAAQVNQSRMRLGVISDLQTGLSAMENSQRGYVIIGDQDDLEQYQAAARRFAQNLTQLKETAASTRQSDNADQLEGMVSRWQQQSAEPEMQARSQSMAAATRLIQSGQGKRQLQEARDLLELVASRENERLVQSVQRNAEASRNMQRLTFGGLLIGSLLILLSVFRMSRRVTASVQQLNTETQRLAQGHYDLNLSRSGVRELDQLAAQFREMALAVQERETQLEATSQALRTSNQDLQRSNRELERFAYVASHDLQEPLRTIGSYTELLAKRYGGQLDARADQYIHFTISATQRLKNLIQDLLAFSRVHRPGREFGEVNVDGLVHDVVNELAVKIAHAQATVQVESLPTVRGNRELLHHVFLNLITNAVKYRQPGRPSQVRVWATREQGGWVFHVQDNGIGIEKAYFEKIFEVFQRLHSSSEYEGSGVGLAVTRSAIEQHGGEIWLDSQVGQGSTFHFRLPDQPVLNVPVLTPQLERSP